VVIPPRPAPSAPVRESTPDAAPSAELTPARVDAAHVEESDPTPRLAFVYGALSVGGVAAVAILFLLMALLFQRVLPTMPAVRPVAEARVPDSSPPVPDSPRETLPVSAPVVPEEPEAPDSPDLPAAPSVAVEPPTPVLNTEEVVAKNEHAVAFVKGRISSGTGFLVADGILATNAHVVESELVDDLEVHFPSASREEQGPYQAQLVYEDSRRDLAFLLVPSKLAPLALAPANARFRRGQDLVAIGCPGIDGAGALQNAVSRGILSTELVLGGQKWVQIDMAINSGNSGGPVISSTGHAVGVATLKARGKDGLAFCIPAADVRLALASLGSQPALRSAEVASLHRARVCCLYVARVSSVYLLGMDLYAESAQRALADGRPVGEQVKRVADKIEPDLETIRTRFVGDIVPVLRLVTADTNIPWGVRNQIRELWTNYNTVKQHVERPRGSVEAYRQSAEGLRRQHEQLMAALHLSLGVEVGR